MCATANTVRSVEAARSWEEWEKPADSKAWVKNVRECFYPLAWESVSAKMNTPSKALIELR
jgi:hypothetical protein